MKLLIALVVVSVVSVNAGEDWKMFMKWAKTKAMESCWGEENMKLHTLNMKKAVSKCLQVDAPETELPPFRYLNRFTNNLVSMANNNQRYGQSHNNEDEVVKMMKMMMMMKMMKSFGQDEDHHSSRHGCNGYHDCDDSYSSQPEKMMRMMMRSMMNTESHDRMDSMDMDNMDAFSKMFRQMKTNKYDSYKSNDYSPMMKRFMGGFQKRQAGDSLELNDRLKEKLENLMTEHVSELSNMTCVLREMNVLDTRNKIDINAMKADTDNYQVIKTS